MAREEVLADDCGDGRVIDVGRHGARVAEEAWVWVLEPPERALTASAMRSRSVPDSSLSIPMGHGRHRLPDVGAMVVAPRPTSYTVALHQPPPPLRTGPTWTAPPPPVSFALTGSAHLHRAALSALTGRGRRTPVVHHLEPSNEAFDLAT
ncbi:hypothetical protein E2562_023650 [Oryza meyeriana var. granulata]|uniref:Uncharacterized protein n=1 Tax=Oryza meyeriana var. granulata TaxID=110450 RepID=A0A6G1BNL1_9ORYZ|nr:hypothetical protein E2562_023650 [Oryza meyeriana var. granulata]